MGSPVHLRARWRDGSGIRTTKQTHSLGQPPKSGTSHPRPPKPRIISSGRKGHSQNQPQKPGSTAVRRSFEFRHLLVSPESAMRCSASLVVVREGRGCKQTRRKGGLEHRVDIHILDILTWVSKRALWCGGRVAVGVKERVGWAVGAVSRIEKRASSRLVVVVVVVVSSGDD